MFFQYTGYKCNKYKNIQCCDTNFVKNKLHCTVLGIFSHSIAVSKWLSWLLCRLFRIRSPALCRSIGRLTPFQSVLWILPKRDARIGVAVRYCRRKTRGYPYSFSCFRILRTSCMKKKVFFRKSGLEKMWDICHQIITTIFVHVWNCTLYLPLYHTTYPSP